ncbi:hypothetical protein N480_19210 [Pseudoalteromonas luteoviolacea S2607]|uniref:AAA family ATPase n=1 Tax=Pseudoalteromonas luteoviolacea TaxID=43657 RepID=UPI0007B0AE95|nr:AAA family ATPase [Pseudoalteromonas luteoviolacea]KZN35315.1 hypothetical protein N480_19210 [Pseudoalteromonas luteoviolacea S2607]
MAVDFDAMALRARTSLRELSEDIDTLKAEIDFKGLPTYTKAAVYKQFQKLSRTSVDKYIAELEAEGTTLQKKIHGSIEVYNLSIEDIIKIYEKKGEKKWRDRHDEATVIFVNSLKGGVTKTVSTVSIAQGFRLTPDLVKEDLRIAVIDMDPQGSATMFLNHHYTVNNFDYTAAQICVNPHLSREEILEKGFVNSNVPGVKLMPASIEDGFVASSWMGIHEELKSEGYNTPVYDLLKTNLIDKIKHDFDFIFLDTGPHLDPLLMNSFVASHFLIMPAPPAHVDMHSTLKFLERLPSMIKEIETNGSQTNIIGFYGFLTKFIPSKEEHRTSQRHYVKTLDDMLPENLPSSEAFNKVGQSYETVLTIQGKDYDGSKVSLKLAADAVKKLASALFYQVERDLEKVK